LGKEKGTADRIRELARLAMDESARVATLSIYGFMPEFGRALPSYMNVIAFGPGI
jgi:hypothetical protein